VLIRLPQWLRDAAVVLVVGASSVGPAIHLERHLWITLPMSLVATAAIYFRRRSPVLVLAIETAAAVVAVAFGHAGIYVGVLFAVYAVAALTNRGVSVRATLVAAVVLTVPLLRHGKWHPSELIGPVLLLGLAWFAGETARLREHDAQEKLRQAAAEERARITRELHDVVTHNVSVMVVQAAAAGEVFESRPEQSRAAISEVEETGRRALNELRRLLGSVSGDDGGVLPQPSLERLDELVDRVRAAGLNVNLVREGDPERLPEGIELSAYRIVQESLTNTIKHAHASRVTVVVRYRPDELEVEVTDDGVGAPEHGEGRGLIGMRERVALYGGELDAGARSGGGFGVRARIPVAAS
jgi:signal transduction histidine kinase